MDENSQVTVQESEYHRLRQIWMNRRYEKGWFSARNFEIIRRNFLGERTQQIANRLGKDVSYQTVYRTINSPPGKALFQMLQELAFNRVIDVAAENYRNAQDGVKLLGRIIRNEVTFIDPQTKKITTRVVGDDDRQGFYAKLRAEQARFSIEASGYGPKHVSINISGPLTSDEIGDMGKRGENALKGEYEVVENQSVPAEIPEPTEEEISALVAVHTPKSEVKP